ncbi:TIGR02281 family clan AA aspartic protease [Sinirhodobacter populi]|uniref:TIGR02281 family clan AA aspartic protease n=1 Tax=Paenirhodobacter populi TaxID=2306993 RepID=A0A443K0M5_9RHOB|nr:TIGR02281 family clan AA aspartic protease [Sinirhodobacter populi]RWR26266.1 TIGR02281 family clan AA aspartic protease [Sinirhodobacter populi]
MLDSLGPQLIFYLLLLMAFGGYFFVSLRSNFSKTLQQVSVWALLFLGLIGVYGLKDDIRQNLFPAQNVLSDGRIEVPRSPDGHYYLTASVNGVPVRFVVDTGASQIVLSQRDAERAGIETASLAYVGQANTANGTVAIAPVRLNTVDLGPIHDRDLRAVVNRGEMDLSLMGMTYLTRFARVEFDRDRMILER